MTDLKQIAEKIGKKLRIKRAAHLDDLEILKPTTVIARGTDAEDADKEFAALIEMFMTHQLDDAELIWRDEPIKYEENGAYFVAMDIGVVPLRHE